MFLVKTSICACMAGLGGALGYVMAQPHTWAAAVALGGMFAAALAADILTQPLEGESADENDEENEAD